MKLARIGIIGLGRLGFALYKALNNKNLNVTSLFNRSKSKYCGISNNPIIMNSIQQLVNNSDIIFICTRDDEIKNVANEIYEIFSDDKLDSKKFFHMSGSLTSDELEKLKLLGANVGSFHPIQTFVGKKSDVSGFENIVFGYEGDETLLETVYEIVKLFNSNVIIVKKEHKALYHACACIISNYLTSLFYCVKEIYEFIGVDEQLMKKALMPLVQKTLDNIKKNDVIECLSGPIIRTEEKLINEHINELNKFEQRFIELYKSLGKFAVEISKQNNGVNMHKLKRIEKILNE